MTLPLALLLWLCVISLHVHAFLQLPTTWWHQHPRRQQRQPRTTLSMCELCVLRAATPPPNCNDPKKRAGGKRQHLMPLLQATINGDDNDNAPPATPDDDDDDDDDDDSNTLKDAMISAIRWYRRTLSPMMPPNCRFLPSCSNYAIDAISTYGPWRGGVLTAWRLFRCNPTGGCGYDPPRWPPPGYWAGSNSKPWF
jgi:hypothetical protein